MSAIGSVRSFLFDSLLRNCYRYGYAGPITSVTSRYPIGTNVFEREWDALILLDTCRVDALGRVAPEYEFLPSDVGSLLSVGSTSSEWIAQTFSDEYADTIGNTAYVSANGHAKYVLEDGRPPEEIEGIPAWTNWKTVGADQLGTLEHVWQHDEQTPGHVRPEFVTDKAIETARQGDFGRLIIHYSQPHAPYAARALREDDEMADYESQPFRYLVQGGDRQKVMKAYYENLRSVLDSVGTLLENIDADRTIISADHGEAFGEWSMYSHQIGALHPQIKRVPWAETTASDTGTHVPDRQWAESGHSVEEHLEALGYKT